MENLNDVEFGSDKSGEEAPILVAQRYLNIFRQVHIFNKAKRDEFDNELLALPQNITDFFKRMPGGRLLVEHIEQVKTERGIAFVKANKEDFDEGAGKTDTPHPTAGGQVVAGSVTIDASFAEALANALANAFKQLPQSPIATTSGTGPTTISADFGNAFDVIAEEIRTSRASLLDVLKETRSITDSVIASQVSISRILEGILATRDRDDTDIADLNNRIIASQVSITKLLEGLYTASNKKNAEISEYLNVENRLRRFREEITNDLDISLQKMQELFRLCAESVQNRKVVIETRPASSDKQAEVVSADLGVEASASSAITDKSYQQEDFTAKAADGETLAQVSERPAMSAQAFRESPKPMSQENKSFEHSEIVTAVNPRATTFTSNTPVDDSLTEHRKKKKKKKKNRDNILVNDGQSPLNTAGVAYMPVSEQAEKSQNEHRTTLEKNFPASDQKVKETLPSFDGVIRNKAFKHEDRFDNVRLDIPPLDTDDVDEEHLSSPKEHTVTNTHNIPERTLSSRNEAQSSGSNQKKYVSDDLDFELPDVHSNIDDMSEDNSTTEIEHISNLSETTDIEDDDLDFALPEVNFSNEDIADSSSSMGFDDISKPEQSADESLDFDDNFSDGLDFALPDIEDNDNQSDDIQSLSDETDVDVSTTHSGEGYQSRSQLENESEPHVSSLNETSQADASEKDIISPLDNFMAIHNEDISTRQSNAQHPAAPVAELKNLPETLTNTEEASEPSLDDLLNGSDNAHHPLTEQSTSVADVSYSDANASTSMSDAVASVENTSTLDDFLGVSDKESVAPDVSTTQAPTLDDFMNSHNQEIEDSDAHMDAHPAAKDQSLDDFIADPSQADNQTDAISQTNETLPDGDVVSSSSPVSYGSEEIPTDTHPQNPPHEREAHQSRYSAELDKIREALTSDSVDLSSLDQPIELDDYSDDENVGKDDYDDILSHLSESHENASDAHIVSDVKAAPIVNSDMVSSAPDVSQKNSENATSDDDQDWEWEYVDEDGNEVPADDDQDWEWEYVEDDDTSTNADDNKK